MFHSNFNIRAKMQLLKLSKRPDDVCHVLLNSRYCLQRRNYLKHKCSGTSNRQTSMQQQQNMKEECQQQIEKAINASISSAAASETASATAASTTTLRTIAPSTSTTPPNEAIILPYNIDWIFPQLLKPSKWWFVLSEIVILAVGIFSKIVLVFMNKTQVYHKQRLIDAITKRPAGTPLITVSNHYSCFDDPGLWGILPVQHVCNTLRIRWSLAAHDICFTNKYHSLFFMYGKCIPVIRGIGVYQDAVNLCIQKMKLGHWVHIFPEGKVNTTKEEVRLKWGVGRVIYESPKVPLILPMWHEGMDDVLPNIEPYRLQWGKKVTLNIGHPIDMKDFIQDLKCRGVKEAEARKLITDKIQEVFRQLRSETENLHWNRS